MLDIFTYPAMTTLTHHAGSLTQTIRFVRRGDIVSLSNVPPTRTLLEVLREDLGHTGTKEGCGEGDCGACTVVLGEAQADGGMTYRAVNSCIRLAHSVDGLALWTVEDLAKDPLLKPALKPTEPQACESFGLHPAQEALVQCHGSQCGFCTPGFVMSLFGMYQQHVVAGVPITRELVQRDLSGNLCRCTGYRPIFDAAQQMEKLPAVQVDEPALRAQLARIRPEPQAQGNYLQPTTLAALLQARSEHPAAQLVAGCTDVGLWINKLHKDFEQIIDVTRAAELRVVSQQPGRLRIGAAVPLEDAFSALCQHWPELKNFAERFAGLPVRNAGTLGGNVANGSPIGDGMPLLIALGAQLVLASVRGECSMPVEDFYTGYRKNLLAADEVLAFIDVPLPPVPTHQEANWLRAYKISKRYDDDISAVCLVIHLQIADGRVQQVSMGAGGVAATPVRARQTEAVLRGQPWQLATVQAAMAALRAEFEPISDMRASAAYRREVLGNLLQRFWLETQGQQQINLAHIDVGTFEPVKVLP